jgi:hypothetical protein
MRDETEFPEAGSLDRRIADLVTQELASEKRAVLLQRFTSGCHSGLIAKAFADEN